MGDCKRRSGETDIQYHKRLVYGKLANGTLSDYDYSELAPYVYGKEYSTDVARRMMYGSKRTLDIMESDAELRYSSEDVINEINKQKFELQKERQRFFDQRREFNKLAMVTGRYEHIESRLIEAADGLNETIGNIFQSNEFQPPRKISDEYWNNENEAVLVLCDWHYGLVANNVWNNYDTEICKERVKCVVDGASKRIIFNRCSRLHVFILGDMIHGAIHTSARVASEELVSDQLMQVSEIIAQAIAKLSTCVDEVCVYTTYGNHARVIQNKQDSVHRDNIERFIPWWLRYRLREAKNITIIDDSDSEFLLADINGVGFCGSHGDLDQVKSSPRMLSTLFQRKYNRKIDCILLADKHHRDEFEEIGVSSMIVGSLCGTDDYANDRRLYSTPEQLLLIVNSSVGIDAVYHIRCDT